MGRSALRLVAFLAACDLALHLAVGNRYGYWIDELYFVACGRHLAWGYVDHPPLIAVAARLSTWLGDSLIALRVLPAVAGATLVFAAGWTARWLGGGRTAQIVAAVGVLASPVHQLFSSVLTMNSFEPLFWFAGALVAMRIARGGSPSLWIAFGALVGVGFLNKHSILFFVAALAAGLVLTPQRSLLRSGWIWAGAALAALIAAPHLLWQAEHGWPTLELLANAQRFQVQPVTPLEFVWGQVQLVNPLALPIWLAGVVFFLRNPLAVRLRFVGLAFVLLFGVFLVIQAKSYYLGPFYPLLFAAGGVELEALATRLQRAWIPWVSMGLTVVGGLIILPYVVPLLPLEMVPKYMQLLPLSEVRSETRRMGNVPQIFADMLAWEELVAEVGRVYAALTPDDRARAVLWGSGYGSAAAIDLYGAPYGLPPAVSGHQNYFLWGTTAAAGDPWVAVGFAAKELAPWFESVELAGEVECDECMPDRARQQIFVCRGLRVAPQEFWPLVKCWTCDRPAFTRSAPNA